MKQRAIDTESGSLYAIEAGKGALVLLLHGVTATAHVFEPIVELLAPCCHVVAVDQRGHGRSSAASDGRYDASAYASDVAASIEGLGERPALVVGHSLGARNAIVAGATYPSLIAGVVAVDFTPFVPAASFDRLDERVASGERSFGDLDDVVGYLAARYPRLPADAIRRRAEHGYEVVSDGRLRPLADRAAMAATCLGLRADLAPELVALGVPALLVRGADSTFVTADAFETTKRLRPDIEAVVVEGTDHYVPEEAPTLLADLIRGALAKLDSPSTEAPSALDNRRYAS